MLALNDQRRMYLALTREQAIETTIHNLIDAGILLRSEAGRYRKVLESYPNETLIKVLLYSHELKEAAIEGGGEIILGEQE